jgi:ABC-type sugar transport system substrate-binding protein
MPATKRIQLALLLVDAKNPYQLMLQADAEATARRMDVDLLVHFCGHDAGQQLQRFYTYLQADPASRPQAIIILPHRDAVLARAAREAADAGIGLAVLNRVPASLEAVRLECPGVPVLSFSPDQRDMGRIQGQQFTVLMPKGGRLAYVRGDTTTASAKERQAGTEEVIRGTSIEINVLDGGWVSEIARKSVSFWLRSMTMMKAGVDLIGCQNDDMALGARAAVDALAAEMNRPDLRGIRICGMDGVADAGQKYVTSGLLTATIISPSTSGAAVEALAQYYARGVQPPPKTVLKGRSFPEISALSASRS